MKMYPSQESSHRNATAAAGQLGRGEMDAKREKEVLAAFRRLGQMVESLESATGTLHERIGPVVSVEPPQPVSTEKAMLKGAGCSAKLAHEIYEIADRIERVIMSTNSVSARVEI